MVCGMTGISMEKSFLQGADILNEGRDHYSNHHQSPQPHQPFAVNVNNSFFSSFFHLWRVLKSPSKPRGERSFKVS